jgi:phytoene/squalene synthetase
VGRLLLHLFRSTNEASFRWSDSICSALQLVNFWQDIAIDYAKGRVYLPQDEMRRFGVTEQHIAGRRCDEAWRALIQSQIARARDMLKAGEPLGRALPGRIGLEIRATVQGGLRILEKLERARGMLKAGEPLGRELPGRIGLEIRATVQGGLRILEKLERARCDMFRRRPVLKWHDWPVILARAL